MADALPKVNAAAALTVPLALARKGYTVVSALLAQHAVGDKVAKLGEHPMVMKMYAQKELLLAVVGLALVLHGTQFTNLLLCTQVVVAFLYERVKESVTTIYSDLVAVNEQLKKDAPAEEPKDTSDEQNKHAKKRADAKKAVDKVGGQSQKDDAEAAKKVLKALDSKRLSAAATEVLAAMMACLLVIHGGLARKVAVTHALVGLVAQRLEVLVEFPGYEDLQAWINTLLRLALWIVLLPVALVAAPLALALDASLTGAQLATEHGARFLVAMKKLEDADKFLSSFKGLQVFGGLSALGLIWQLWTLSSGGSIAWYFQLIYLPAIIAEGVLGLL